MLQNRVTPEGEIIRTPARGAWTGNRGVIHDEQKQIRRPFKIKAWITCLLQFKNRHREVMTPNRWTELFFYDEATAFSAGHRPCGECRRTDYDRFKTAWIKGNPQYGFDKKTSIKQIDEVLHKERINRNKVKITYETGSSDLPDGAFILYHNTPHVKANGHFFPWAPEGYGTPITLPETEKVTVLTPQSIVNAFHAGYTPQIRLGVKD